MLKQTIQNPSLPRAHWLGREKKTKLKKPREYYSATKKEWNGAFCRDVDGPRVCHIEWSKSERGKQIPYIDAYMWNLKNATGDLIHKEEIETQTENKQNIWIPRGQVGWNEFRDWDRHRSTIGGEGNGNPLQHSCLENPMDRGAWGLQSMESHRVGHHWSDLAQQGTYHWYYVWNQ